MLKKLAFALLAVSSAAISDGASLTSLFQQSNFIDMKTNSHLISTNHQSEEIKLGNYAADFSQVVAVKVDDVFQITIYKGFEVHDHDSSRLRSETSITGYFEIPASHFKNMHKNIKSKDDILKIVSEFSSSNSKSAESSSSTGILLDKKNLYQTTASAGSFNCKQSTLEEPPVFKNPKAEFVDFQFINNRIVKSYEVSQSELSSLVSLMPADKNFLKDEQSSSSYINVDNFDGTIADVGFEVSQDGELKIVFAKSFDRYEVPKSKDLDKYFNISPNFYIFCTQIL